MSTINELNDGLSTTTSPTWKDVISFKLLILRAWRQFDTSFPIT